MVAFSVSVYWVGYDDEEIDTEVDKSAWRELYIRMVQSKQSPSN
jgi:hypothetical protein